MLSSFHDETYQHVLELGIVLGKNHPVLNNQQFITESVEKVKGIRVEAVHKEVSTLIHLSYFFN